MSTEMAMRSILTVRGEGVNESAGHNEIMSDPRELGSASGVVAVFKPSGLATQAPPGIASVESWLRGRLHGAETGGYLGVPHRLDRPVSGVLLMAATPRAARKLSRQFERRQVRKTYLAMVVPRDEAARQALPPLVPAAAEWRDLVEKVVDEPRGRIAAVGAADAREALTLASTWLRLADEADGRAILRLEPLTGRMHQLRIQAAARGLPVVGDTLYGGAAETAWGHGAQAAAIALHAWRIAYADPDTGAEVVVTAPLPAAWPAAARAAAQAE
ncbi:MAG: RNA pseudouridine synthase [Planctomycetota bacterium]|nr:MAG: RNA pseudouridine synthase [Planctomycetota bacterium]